jgi:pimeloyl-ACP methyl ester carboxylesterase
MNLILLHGALGSAAQFDPWLPLLEKNFRVHAFDLEGHGSRAFADRPFRIAHFAENLADFLRENDLVGSDIFGYSMGGYVALYLARQAPEMLGKIHTFATKLAWSSETSAREVKMLDPETILQKVPKFAQVLEMRHHGNDWREHLARTADLMLDLGQSPALLPADFEAIPNRVRMGIGDRDNMVTILETEQYYRHLPLGEMLVLPNTPHPIEKMDPAHLCTAITEFFKDFG